MRVTDQLGVQVLLEHTPRKIVSIVPSQTELLYTLGLDETISGITSFCIHPPHWKKTKAIIGGTKKLKLDLLEQLQPDLIIANKEENDRAQVLVIAEKFPVYTSDINTLTDALQMITDIGILTGKKKEAAILVSRIAALFDQLKKDPFIPLRTAYLIWRKPYMSVGEDTFIHQMMQAGGFENVFGSFTRYPVIGIKELQVARCELVFLSSEPYPFREKHVAELREQLPGAAIVLVDGEAFSWYGSRLLQTPAYLQQLRNDIGTLK